MMLLLRRCWSPVAASAAASTTAPNCSRGIASQLPAACAAPSPPRFRRAGKVSSRPSYQPWVPSGRHFVPASASTTTTPSPACISSRPITTAASAATAFNQEGPHRRRGFVAAAATTLLACLPAFVWAKDSLVDLYRVEGTSMEPALREGDYVLVRKCEFGALLDVLWSLLPFSGGGDGGGDSIEDDDDNIMKNHRTRDRSSRQQQRALDATDRARLVKHVMTDGGGRNERPGTGRWEGRLRHPICPFAGLDLVGCVVRCAPHGTPMITVT
jgi:hypothetical protein